MVLTYPIGTSGQMLVLTGRVLAHFGRHRQRDASYAEAGGQLFARLRDSEIRVERATGPRRGDRRAYASYRPDREAEQREIESMFAQNYHYVGDWHTHPADVPEPSSRDAASMRECFAASTHQLNGFVLIIVGTAPPPHGLHVSLYNAVSSIILASVWEG